MSSNNKNSFFYSNIDSENINNSIIQHLENYALNHSQRIYLVNRPLSEKKYDYTVNQVLIFLSPNHNIQFINLSLDENDFEEIYLDFIEDLGHISDKYDYTKIIKRPRVWKKFIRTLDINEFLNLISQVNGIEKFMESNRLSLDNEKRTVKLLITLLTGSINSVDRIGEFVPESILDKVKQSIILFDGDQTRFIFKDNYNDKIIKIQGLAGTGKTELLLHRLKEIYVSDKESKILFTCQSKTLSNKLRSRITDFFNFMRVEEQIEWEERLWVMHAWGSVKDPTNRGTYASICKKYQLPFYNSFEGSFASACKKTLDYIEHLKIKIEPFFDYMLIDEGQDFTESFVKLCSLVTKKQVFLAGDIFQDIFGIQDIETDPQYLLNKCYRTDPRTLMFSHALGLALYEKPSLRFLKDHEWEACGYKFTKQYPYYIFTRDNIDRFEDIDFSQISSGTKLITYDKYNSSDIIKVIKEIKLNYPDVEPDDIAIVFTNPNLNYSKIDVLAIEIYREFLWDSNYVFNSKNIIKSKVSISNKNNIKGLEFPFVICIADYTVNRNLQVRNTLYMALTRSFISSYLVIQNDNNEELIETLNKSLEEINNSLSMKVLEPTEEEREQQDTIIKEYNKPSPNQLEVLTKIFNDLEIPTADKAFVKEIVKKYRPLETDYDELKLFILSLLGGNNGKRN